MGKDIKVRLAMLGKTQVELLNEIRKRGFKKLTPQALSSYITGRDTTPQSEVVLKIARDILKEWEVKHDDSKNR